MTSPRNPFLIFLKNNLILCILELITLAALLTAGLFYRQFDSWERALKIIPLFISLVVMFLQAQVNRFAFILGGVNSALYAISYFLLGLPASALYALLFSFPLQIITFINWQRKSTGTVTELRNLTGIQRILLLVGGAACWGIMYLVFSLLKSPYLIFDITITLLGIVATIFTMLRYREYTFIQLITLPINLITYIQIFLDDPAQITYVIYSAYTIICVILARIRMTKQKKAMEQSI